MQRHLAVLLGMVMVGLAGCATAQVGSADEGNGTLVVREQGMFSSGGTVTDPAPGAYDPTKSFLDGTRAGNTAHVDHANVLYQIPEGDNGHPVVFLHGYGQSRMGWISTPDGRDGWGTMMLRDGYPVFLVDQPRRGEAGNTAAMTSDALDADGTAYLPGDQAWYTHFRIGRVAPERYEGSQFPEGAEAQDQFFRMMTPNTGSFDLALDARAMGAVLDDVYERTGEDIVYVTHSQGGLVGWATPLDHVAAIVAIEPGSAPEVGSDQYRALLEKQVPILMVFGDNIDNGPADLMSTGFWQSVRDGANAFAEQYVKDGGDAKVIDLPKEGITGNSHFLFDEMNNREILDLVEDWLDGHGLR